MTDYFSILPLTRRYIRSQFAGNRAFIREAELKAAQYYTKLLSEKRGFREWRGYDELLQDRNNILGVAQWCYKSIQKKPLGSKLPKNTVNIAEILVQIGIHFGSVLWQRAYWYDRLTLAHAAISADEAALGLEVRRHVCPQHFLDLFLPGRLPEGSALGRRSAIGDHKDGGSSVDRRGQALPGDGRITPRTRTFPNKVYTPYLRAGAGADRQLRLDRVTGAATQPNQSTQPLGLFLAAQTRTVNTYTYMPLVDAFNAPRSLRLSGATTVWLTSLGRLMLE